ncbi:MAG: hypothetical protein R3C45_08270 [Phycisphaerales bacterium]
MDRPVAARIGNSVRITFLILLASALCTLYGCAPKSTSGLTGLNADGRPRITEAELQNELDEFADRFSGVVSAAANEIASNSTQRTARKASLYWKLRMIPRLEDMIFGADPQEAFLDAATLTVQMRKYLQGPDTDGANLFADLQPGAVSACLQLEEDIFRIGALFLNNQQLETLRAEVDAYSSEHPIRGTFSLTEGRVTSSKEGGTASFSWVTQVPMSPFRALEGIDAGARAISDFNTTASQFAQIVEDIPQQTRWQIELLWYDLEERESVVSMLNSFKTLSDSAASLSETARQLPVQLREQLALATKDIEDRQAALQKTLDETRQTLDTLNTAIDNATELTDSISQAGGSVAQAGDAWRDAVKAINDLTQSAPVSTETTQTSAAPGKPFDIAEYAQAADKLTATATELRALLAEARVTIDSIQVSALSDAALKDAEQRGRNVTDHAAWRALQLLAVAFVLAIVYRLISARLAPQHKNK